MNIFWILLTFSTILSNISGISIETQWNLFKDFLDKTKLSSGIFCSCGFLTRLNFHEFENERKNFWKRISFQFPPKQLGITKYSYGIYLNAKCPETFNYLKYGVENSLFTVRQKWMILVEDEEFLKDTLNYFEILDINLDSDISIAIPGESEALEISNLYKVRAARTNVSSHYFYDSTGSWSKDEGYTLKRRKIHGLVAERRNFLNQKFYGGVYVSECFENLRNETFFSALWNTF